MLSFSTPRHYIQSMRSYLKRLLEALECLVSSIEALRDMYATAHDFEAQSGNVGARVEELERSRALWVAEMEAELMLVKAEYRKADNAAARAKTAARQAAESPDSVDESPEEFRERYEAYLREHDGEGGKAEAVPILHRHVAGPADVRAGLRAQKRGA